MSIDLTQGGGNIYKAIPAIMAEIGAIGKDRKNQQQGYTYRGIEDFYNVCQPLMVKYKIFSVSEILERSREERTSKSGGTLIYSVLKMRYRFYADDGSSVSTEVVGEGMDSGDKSNYKAMSGAHKYALAQIFAVPTEDMVDPEVDSPEPAPKPTMAQAAAHTEAVLDKAADAEKRQALEKEIVRLATLLGNDELTTARKELRVKRDMVQSKAPGYETYNEYLNKLSEFKMALSDQVAEKGVL